MDVLIERHKTDLYSLCRKLTRGSSDADDLFQDTWVNVMKNLESYSTDHRFKTWLFAICLNRYRDLYRWRKRWWRRVTRLPSGDRPDDEHPAFLAPDPGPEQALISEERKTAVREALDKLEDMFRLPMLLHYFQDLSMVEIGEILEIPPGTVKSRLSAGREKLRVAMEGAGHGRS
jgi:RNA polymerase sigma-70 factor (ECF subfamily)